MAIKIGTQLVSPDGKGVQGWVDENLGLLKKGVTGAIGIATRGLTEDLRREIEEAGLGPKLPNSVRGRVYPGGGKASLRAAGFINPSGKGAADILEAFSQGVTIRSSNGFWLAIPTEAAGKMALGKRITPGLWEQATGLRLQMVMHGRNALLVAEQRGSTNFKAGSRFRRRDTLGGGKSRTAVIFILVRQVSLNKRLRPEEIAQAWADRVPDLIDRAIPNV